MEPNRLHKLVKKRGVIKTQMTRMKTFIDEFVPSENNIHEITVRLRRFPDIMARYDSVQSELETEDLQSDHDDDRAVFEETAYEVEGQMELILRQAEERSGNPGPSSRAPGELQVSGVSHMPHGSLRLPLVSLPSFDGKYEEWFPFADSFTVMVHENADVMTIQKFHYLLSSLKGQALQLIQNLPITAVNYQVAWQLLKDRYENKKLIAATYTRGLLNLKAVQKESASDLRQFVNTIRSNLSALKAMELDQPLGDILVSQLIVERLDKNSRREWEIKESRQSFPPLTDLLTFLEYKSQALENINASSSFSSQDSRQVDFKPKQYKAAQQPGSFLLVKNKKCCFCHNEHPLFYCQAFIAAEIRQRRECVQNNKLCVNCLQAGHSVKQCPISSNCKTCNCRHNTLLHTEKTVNNRQVGQSCQQVQPTNSIERGESSASHVTRDAQGSCHVARHRMQSQVLLSTAIVLVRDSMDQLHKCRALIDCGSQSNFVTEDLVQRLKLKKSYNRIIMQGVNNVSAEAKFTTSVQFHSTVNNYKAGITCSVLTHITGQIPSAYIDSQHWNLPNDIQLADPNFHEPGRIDMLIGAELCFHILRAEKRTRSGDFPVLQNTELGWILSGRYQIPNDLEPNKSVTSCFVRQDDNLTHRLQRFWELEEINSSPKTEEELQCESHFQQNTTRDENGRFVVRLPQRLHRQLGDSCQQATVRFHQLERKLTKHPELREQYVTFMDEYEELGHMKEVQTSTDDKNALRPTYYLPHHAVFKPSSSTTKTRVVFDGSAKTTNGRSLNDILMVGPTVQQDLYSIVLRFRTHEIVFTADITKMYRQVKIHPEDASLQRILWRKSPDQQLKTYELSTVTYGTASAPFLATRSLNKLAEEEFDKYPRAAEILQRDFYVDDALSGSNNLDDALQLQEELIALLNGGSFPLKKWCSNHPALLEAVPPDDREMQLPLEFNKEESIKTLGLSWHPTSDKFLVANSLSCKTKNKITKRVVLSLVASIFDPLGLVSPIVISYKMFLQKLWLHNLQWDDELPSELSSEWQVLHNQLSHVNSIQVDRYVLVKGTQTIIQLHGFSDASEKAYGCSLYIRSTNKQGQIATNLLCSKSRVAPVKKVSLPRLELLGAELLAKLVQKTLPILNLKIDSVFLWTDSTIVLSWIASPATRWKTFVANRVAKIQHHTRIEDWNHVSSSDNPADLISRGIKACDLAELDLWWHGPQWLHQQSSDWPADVTITEDDNIPEEKKTSVTTLATHDHTVDILHRFSKVSKLTRVVAYCLRFINNTKQPLGKRSGSLCTAELQTALTTCIKWVQASTYSQEIRDLLSNKQVSSHSSLRDLHAFLDDQQILRVGGRLRNSQLAYDNKHQIIIPPNHHFTGLIIIAEHLRLSHAGPQLLIASLRQHYWIPRAKQTVKSIIHKCLPCFKLKVTTTQQLMGQLPSARVQPSRPFLNTGTDFAGPFHVKQGLVRSKTTIKCYIAIFVCLATKAIHLELVTGLTSDAFIAALRRFTARRGKCLHLFSDNGTNFVGANNELKELRDLFHSEQHQNKMADYASGEQLQWHFIPPRAPHFGGLWEASVKSMKYHLKRVAGNAVLTMEEFTTLLTQIEACLNSRPITVLSNDSSDPSYLCPGHFLIGAPLMSYPEPCLSDLSESRLSRWQRVQKLYQQLWQRWSTDYLNSLQQRGKWISPESNLQPGMVVLIKEDHLPPLQWNLGVITETFQGKDGHVRVAAVQTSSGVLKRPISKLVPLPIEYSPQTN